LISNITHGGTHRVLTLSALISFNLFAGFILYISNLQIISLVWSDALYPIFYAITGWRCIQASNNSSINEKNAWRFFATACFSLCWAEFFWGFYEITLGVTIPTPSLADVGYLVFPIMMILGIWNYHFPDSVRKLSKAQIGDFGIIFSVIYIAHVFLFQSQISVTESMAAVIIQILYGIELTAALFVGLIAITIHVRGKKRQILTLITSFIAGLFIMNFIYSYALLSSEYSNALPINVIYFISMTLLYMAAFEHDKSKQTVEAYDEHVINNDRAKQWETQYPAIAITLVILEIVYFKDALNESSLSYTYVGVCIFVVSLAYRNWWGHKIEVSLRNEALDSKNKLQILNQDLKRSKDRLQLALEANESGIWDWNLLTDEIKFDSNWLEMTGYTSEYAVINLNDWEKLVHPSDLDEHNETYDLYLNKKINTNESEYRIKHNDGHYIWFNDRGVFAEWDDNGKPVRLIGVDTNITQRKEHEKQISHNQKMDALGKITGGIAHDFNNLLGIILGYTQLLKSSQDKKPEQSNYIEQIHKAGERGAKLTKKLLSFTSKQVYESEKTNLKNVLLQQQDMLQKTLTVRIKLLFDFADEIWPVFLNSSQLEDAILNMGINAMHAMDDDNSDHKLTISVSNQTLSNTEAHTLALEEGDYVLLCLSDTGCGMDEATKTQIFEPFFTTKGDKGSGFGLSQVFGFVERSKGVIIVNSVEGKGCQFLIYLPRYCDETPEISETSTMKVVSGGNETILLVDDELALLDMLTKVLEQKGYQVFIAGSAMDALQILKLEKIDLMITDMIMPKMDGNELSNIVQNKYPDIKIQLVTGYTETKKQDMVDTELHNNMIYKPYNIEKILIKIREILNGNP